jgi:hypothetical protein
MRLYEEGGATQWLVDMAVGLSTRISVGAEYSRPSAAIASTLTRSARFTGRQEERVLVGMLRARLAGLNGWAVDAVGGGGVLFHTHQAGSCVPLPDRCDIASGPVVNERAPVWAVGLDVPIRIATHIELVPNFRKYFLQRGEQTSAANPNLMWQFEWRSSTREAVGVAGRLVW